jgi:ankyrin repeat protein
VTPLHAAASRGYRKIVEILLEAGAPAGARDKSGATPLDDALKSRHMEIADLMVMRQMPRLPQAQPLDMKATLRDAVLRGQTNVVAMLIEHLGPLGSTTLLHDAALKGHVDVIVLLLAHQADVNSRNAQGATPLHDAALAGQRPAAEALLEHGADANALDAERAETPLHRAASWGRCDVVELLLARGADRSLKDKAGNTALDLAVANSQLEVTAVLKRRP